MRFSVPECAIIDGGWETLQGYVCILRCPCATNGGGAYDTYETYDTRRVEASGTVEGRQRLETKVDD